MRVLVTGGGGFIGSHLVESQLSCGNLVRTIDLNLNHLAQVSEHPNVEKVQGSITNFQMLPDLLKGVDIVYHLASAHLDVMLSDEDYWLINVEATKQLLKAAREAGVTRFVHCSTNGVVGETDDIPIDETTDCQPTNIYELTKLAGEEAVLDFYASSGLPTVVIRPSWVYGPRCPRTAKLFRAVRKGRFIMFGDGKTLRHPVFVSDAIKGMELAATSPNASGEVYFIAGERYLPIEELIKLMAELLNVKRPVFHLPLSLGKLASSSLETTFKMLGRRPPISRRSLDFFIKDNGYDISKARRELNYIPQVDLRTGLEKTLATL
jgi:nucleoside-diphosphate-sugar epimerase